MLLKKSEYGTLPPASVQERVDAGTYNLLRAKTITGQWIQDTATGRWWYRHDDGSFTTDDWEQIGDRWHYFDSEGWMQTGWFTDVDGKKYYLHDTEGYMMVQWIQTGGKWYYMDEHGVMATGWVREDNNKYYYMRPSDGSMVTGTNVIDGITCYFNTSSGLLELIYTEVHWTIYIEQKLLKQNARFLLI